MPFDFGIDHLEIQLICLLGLIELPAKLEEVTRR